MKTLITIFLLLVAINTQAQFSAPLGGGFGFRINSDKSYDINAMVLSVEPQVQIGNFSVASQTIAFISGDSTKDEGFSGLKIDYLIKQIDYHSSISAGIHGLIGFNGKKLPGIDITYKNKDSGLNLNLSKEIKFGTYYAGLTFYYSVIK